MPYENENEIEYEIEIENENVNELEDEVEIDEVNENEIDVVNEIEIDEVNENEIDAVDENEIDDVNENDLTEYEILMHEYVPRSSVAIPTAAPSVPVTKKVSRKRRRKELKAQREIDFASSSSSADGEGSPPSKIGRFPKRMEYIDAFEAQSDLARVNRRNTFENRRLFRRVLEDFLDCVVPRLSDEEFKQKFRVTRKTLKQLNYCFEMGAADEKLVPLQHKAHVPLTEYMIMFLWYVGTGNTYKGLASTFDVGIDEAIYVIDVVTTFFSLYAKKLLPFPETRREANFYASSFHQMFKFPGAIGCLTNHHMRIREHPSSHDRYLTTIQTITCPRGRFLNVHINSELKMHPRDILDESPIGETLPALCHEKYHLVADENHFLRQWLLTPFKKPVSRNEILFNERHSAVMNSGYKAWNSLVYRFRQLRNCMLTPENMIGVVTACCMIQNICMDEMDYFELSDDREGSLNRRPNEIARAVNVLRDDPDLRSWGLLKQRQVSHDML